MSHTTGERPKSRTEDGGGRDLHEIQRGIAGPCLCPSPRGWGPTEHDCGGLRPRARDRPGSGFLRRGRRGRHEPGRRSRRHSHRRRCAPFPRPHRSHETFAFGTLFPNEAGEPVLHMHAACGREGDATVGCTRAGLETWFIGEIVLVEIVGTERCGRLDPVSGFELLELPNRTRPGRAVTTHPGRPPGPEHEASAGQREGRTTAAGPRSPAPAATTGPSACSPEPRASGRPSRQGPLPPPPTPNGRVSIAVKRAAAARRLPPQTTRSTNPGQKKLLNGVPRNPRRNSAPAGHGVGPRQATAATPSTMSSTIITFVIMGSTIPIAAGRQRAGTRVRARYVLGVHFKGGRFRMSRPSIALAVLAVPASLRCPRRRGMWHYRNPPRRELGSTTSGSTQVPTPLRPPPPTHVDHPAGRIHLPPHRRGRRPHPVLDGRRLRAHRVQLHDGPLLHTLW